MVAAQAGQQTLPVELVAVRTLVPHPRNYKAHPDDQIAHLMESIKEHGLYRNIVVARDSTILAGHGVVQAARTLGLETVPVVRLDVDAESPQALKLLAGDNEVQHLGEVDDRALSELLKEINETAVEGLLGTGYDAMMLATLAMVTRPASEIASFDEAAHWAGMPEYEPASDYEHTLKLIISFRSEQDRLDYVALSPLRIDKREAATWTTRWPYTERNDTAAVRFQAD
jgi:hypothetical protein